MLYRKAREKMSAWKRGDKVLLVDGARQVGKSTLIEDFIAAEFAHAILIDFTKDAAMLELLLEIQSLEDFVSRLKIRGGFDPSDPQTVVFLDEIQFYYLARERRIKEDPRFAESHVDILTLSKPIAQRHGFRLIVSGSLLGVSLFGVNLNPLGFVTSLRMFPLDFEEFLLASKISPDAIAGLKQHFQDKVPLSEAEHQLYLKLFKEYLVVGGMPEAVKRHVDGEGLAEVSLAQSSVHDWYIKDILQYAPKEDRPIIAEMYRLLPSEIAARNHKFVKSHLDVPNFKNLDLKDRFLWLQEAGVAIPVYNVHDAVFPLKLNRDYKIAKLFANDTGILFNELFAVEDKSAILLEDPALDYGAIYENMAATLLRTHGYEPYFFSTKKGGEIDFIVEKSMTVIPIEIKSGTLKTNKNYEHKALDALLDAKPNIPVAYVFGQRNIYQESERIWCFPIYMIDFMTKGV